MAKINKDVFAFFCVSTAFFWSTLLEARHNERFFFSQNEKHHAVSANIEFDPALFWGVGYHYSLPVTIGTFSRVLNLQSKFRSYTFSYFDIDANASAFLLRDGLFNALVNLGLGYKYATNDIHHANVLGAEVSAMPGFFTNKWALGLDLRFKQGLFQYLRHTNYYKEVYPNVKDGLYTAPDSYLYFALSGGYNFFDTIELMLRAGYRLSTHFKDYSPYLIPYFANVGVIYNF